MKQLSKLPAITLAASLLAIASPAQNGTPPGGANITLDGSSEKAFTASVERARRSLSAGERERFDESLKLARRLFPDDETYRREMNGTPAQRAVEIADRMRQHLDTNRDGEISDSELRVARTEMEGARLNANESAAIATLLNCVTAQELTRVSGIIDVDGNGMGEYAFFGEMTGAVAVRDEHGKPGVGHMSPPALSSAFSVKGGLVERSGYLFQIWLPAADGTAVAEGTKGGVGKKAPGAGNAEQAWCAYAWPIEQGVTGNRAFFVTQDGELFASNNTEQRYSGRKKAPSPYAAFPKGVQKLGFLPERLPPSNDKGDWQREF